MSRADHPSSRLDDVVHQKTRLGILAVLAESGRVEFTGLRSLLGLTDGNLSRHLTVLADAGLVRLDKAFEDRKPRTTVVLLPEGRRAFDAEVASLKDLLRSLS